MGFDWGRIPPVTARKLVLALGLGAGDPAKVLNERYGSPPDETFVGEAWGALRDDWLIRDRAAAKRLSEALVLRGVGSKDLPTRNHEQRLAYLRSCRNSKAVREEGLRVFLEVHGGVATEESAPRRAPQPSQRQVTADDSPDFQADMNATLRRMHRDDVPSVAMSLMVLNAMSAHGEKGSSLDELPTSVASSLMMVLAMGGLEADDRLSKSRVSELRMTPEVDRAASQVARGARNWHQHRSPLELLLEVEDRVKNVVAGGLTMDQAPLMGPCLALQVLSTGGSERAISIEDAASILGWTRKVLAGAADSPDTSEGGRGADRAPHRPQVEPLATSGSSRAGRREDLVTARTVQRRRGLWHANVITALSTISPDEPIEDIEGGGRWWASGAGGTAVWAGAKVTSHGHRVQPVMVDTSIRPARRLGDAQLAAALSDLNIHGGVAQAAWVGGRVHFRSSIAVHSGISGWTGPWAGVAMFASAMAAYHAPTELRGEQIAGPFGQRPRPNHLIAEFSGWNVPDEDYDKFVLPTRAVIAECVNALPKGMAKGKIRQTEVEVRLAGPNGRLEGFLGRRGGRSDDQELVVSVVTRPPWGAGVKFVLRIETGAGEADNQQLAMGANLLEWELLPTLNVWGGWAGEDGCLRLTMFVPQMLMSRDMAGTSNIVTNMLTWAIVRGNTVAAGLGN